MPTAGDIEQLVYYSTRLSRLRVDRAHGVAPHKPILMLSVMELIAQGKIQRNEIYLSPKLISAFLKYWGHLVTTEHKSTIALPFFHLTGDKFWHLRPNPGYGQVKVGSVKALQQVYAYAYLDDELFALLRQESARTELAQTLLRHWFPANESQVQSLYEVNAFEVSARSGSLAVASGILGNCIVPPLFDGEQLHTEKGRSPKRTKP